MAEDEETTIRMLSDYRSFMVSYILTHSGQVIDTASDNLLAIFGVVLAVGGHKIMALLFLETSNSG
jgi:class 3 adenylate cyclase